MWEHKQVLVIHGGTYVRVHPSHLMPYPEKYQSSSESESIIEPTTSPSGPKETSNISISEENNVEEELGTPSDHVEHHQTVRDGPTKQNQFERQLSFLNQDKLLNVSLQW